jgi:uncharacterized protein YprB with RNaseH-like and TPR domain
VTELRERLRRLDRPRESEPVPGDGRDRAAALRERLDRLLGPGRVVPATAVQPPEDRGPVDRFVPGQRVESESGLTFVAEWTAPSGHCHGDWCVDELGRLPSGSTRALFPESLEGVDSPEQVAFLDTETTGLAGGAGTIPFLVGVGRWSPRAGGFRTALYFLEDLDREPALLEALARELAGVRCLVTYNGRAFDVPLLENRHVLARRGWPLSGTSHLDLLHPARTLWSHGQPDCRLATLERSILGHQRRGDIPGSEIPALYIQYLRHGATERLAAVFRHNRDDLLSLAGLLWAVGEVAARGTGGTAVGVGLLHARRGRHAEARPNLEAGLAEDLPRDLRWMALRHLSLALKREGDWERAIHAWDEMRRLRPADPFPVEEAAKALEHRLRKPASALTLIENALASVTWPPGDREAFAHRRARLKRKMGLAGPPTNRIVR